MATNKHTGDVGEHWVLYRLVRAEYTATLAPANAKAVDILAADKDGKRFGTQVAPAGSGVRNRRRSGATTPSVGCSVVDPLAPHRMILTINARPEANGRRRALHGKE